MKLLIVSTCGTSVLTNEAPEDLRRWLTKVANHRELDAQGVEKLAERAKNRTAALSDGDDARRRRLSAEFAGIGAILDKLKPKEIQHVLIHTDTAAGEAAAKIVAEALRKSGHHAQFVTSGGLRTDDLASFREALADITKKIEDFAGWREKGWTIYFNLTGGFKSINGYLQALGMIHADRSVFLFEGSPALMEIPRLPVRLAEADEIRARLDVFRKFEAGYSVGHEDVEDVPESLLLMIGNQAGLSVWGEAVWARVRKTLLAERFLPPLSEKVVVSAAAQRQFDDEATDMKIAFNTALDALSAHLSGVRKVLKSHTFKKLKGNPVPPSTHELYATSGPGARRIFGHYEDGHFAIDTLGEHL